MYRRERTCALSLVCPSSVCAKLCALQASAWESRPRRAPTTSCFQVQGERGSLLLKDFCQLKRTAPVEEWLLQNGSYGRRESVDTLVEAVRSRLAAGLPGEPRGGPGSNGGLITVREGRNAQRLLDAILASDGEWVDISYD